MDDFWISLSRDFMKATYGGIDVLINNAGIYKRDGTLAEQVIFRQEIEDILLIDNFLRLEKLLKPTTGITKWFVKFSFQS